MQVFKLVISYKVLLLVGVLIIFAYYIRRNSNFIRIRGLFKEYVKIFNGAKEQIAFFFGVPFIFAIAFAQIGDLEDASFNTIYVVSTILITMFFSVLTVLLGKDRNKDNQYALVLKQTISTLLFEIIQCIYCVLFSFVFQMVKEYLSEILRTILSGCLYYMIFFMLLNMFIVVKRFKVLIDTEV